MGMENSSTTSGSVTPIIPRVSIGLPVYNGERFLREALDSVLSQTFQDFELIISDNASTDGTEQICRAYAAKDERIRYFRNEINLGAAKNFNRVIELSLGQYFKYLAADDAIEPQFLERCVTLLDNDPETILACTKYAFMNEFSETIPLGTYDYCLDYCHDLRSPQPNVRFRNLWAQPTGDVLTVFGLIRCNVLRETRMMRSFVGADHCLVAELVLKGKFAQDPAYLNRMRTHPGAYHRMRHRVVEDMQGEAESRYVDPQDNSRFLAFHWRRLWKYARLIIKSDETPVGKATMLAYLVYPIAYWWRVILIKELFFTVGAESLYNLLRNKARRIIAWRQRSAGASKV